MKKEKSHKEYGKPDYQASATVINESHRVMAIIDEARSDDGAMEDLGHCRNGGSGTHMEYPESRLHWQRSNVKVLVVGI